MTLGSAFSRSWRRGFARSPALSAGRGERGLDGAPLRALRVKHVAQRCLRAEPCRSLDVALRAPLGMTQGAALRASLGMTLTSTRHPSEQFARGRLNALPDSEAE